MTKRTFALALAALLLGCSEDPTEPDDVFISAAVFTAYDDDSNEVLTAIEFEDGVRDDDWFGDLDDNDDEVLTDTEFADEVGDGHSDLFVELDTNADDRLDATELIEGLFDVFDANDDQSVTRAEFTSGVGIFED